MRRSCRAKKSSPAAAIASSPRVCPWAWLRRRARQRSVPQHPRNSVVAARQIEEVLVVTKITEKMPDSKDLGPLRASDILAERLPTVPNKAEVDAAGNAKPGSATPGTPPSGTTAPAIVGAHPTASGPTPTKPATPAPTANKPATTVPRTTAPGTAGTVKPKPTQAAGTTTTARPNNAATAPTNGVRVVDNDAPATPRPKRTPPAETTSPEQPAATPSGGASPQ